MRSAFDWSWKLREAVDRIKTRYNHIGRQSGAPFLAIVYPPMAEVAVLKEWQTLLATLGPEFELKSIDVLKETMSVVDELGVDNIMAAMDDPMPGSNAETDLGAMWTAAIVGRVKEIAARKTDRRIVISLEKLAALYPVTGPRALMQQLWDNEGCALKGPVVVLIPGMIIEPKVYSFLDKRREFMYRGDIL